MVEADILGLPIVKQCAFLLLSWSSFYYTPKGETVMNLMLIREVNEQLLETSFYSFAK